ncbi:MAG: hypothetical protein ACLTTF_10865, partial [Oscillospiraceae bacterium]
MTDSQGFAPYSMRRFRPGQAIWTFSYSLYHHLDKVNQNSSEMPKLYGVTLKAEKTEMNCSPSRGQRKNIKFFRPA